MSALPLTSFRLIKLQRIHS